MPRVAYDHNMSDIPKNEEILSLLDEVSAPTPPRGQAEGVARSYNDD